MMYIVQFHIFPFFQDLDFQLKIFFEFCFVKTLKFTYNWNEIKIIYSKHSLFPAFCIPGCVMFVYSLKRFLINRADAKHPIRAMCFNEFIMGRFDQSMRYYAKKNRNPRIFVYKKCGVQFLGGSTVLVYVYILTHWVNSYNTFMESQISVA